MVGYSDSAKDAGRLASSWVGKGAELAPSLADTPCGRAAKSIHAFIHPCIDISIYTCIHTSAHICEQTSPVHHPRRHIYERVRTPQTLQAQYVAQEDMVAIANKK